MENREAHAMVDTAFSIRGVEPYPLPLRLWMGSPNWARAGAVGTGLGVGYVAWGSSEPNPPNPFKPESSDMPILGKKQSH